MTTLVKTYIDALKERLEAFKDAAREASKYNTNITDYLNLPATEPWEHELHTWASLLGAIRYRSYARYYLLLQDLALALSDAYKAFCEQNSIPAPPELCLLSSMYFLPSLEALSAREDLRPFAESPLVQTLLALIAHENYIL